MNSKTCPTCGHITGVSGGRDICVKVSCPDWGKEIK